MAALKLDYWRCWLVAFNSILARTLGEKRLSDAKRAKTIAKIEAKVQAVKAGSKKWSSKWDAMLETLTLFDQEHMPGSLVALTAVVAAYPELFGGAKMEKTAF